MKFKFQFEDTGKRVFSSFRKNNKLEKADILWEGSKTVCILMVQ